MKKLGIWIPIIFILIGAGIIFFILAGKVGEEKALSDKFFTAGTNAEYLGIYLKGHKVGYLASRIDTMNDGYRVYSNTYMKMAPTKGLEKEVTYKIAANTDLDFNLKNFNFRMVSGNYLFQASGKREGNKLVVDMNVGGEKRRTEYNLESSYIPATIEGMVKTGKTGKFQFFDPTMQSLFKISVEKLGIDTLNGTPAIKYVVQQSGIDIFFWVSDEGQLLRSESPIGLAMKREEGIVKSDIETAGFKLYDSYAIRVDKQIINPRNLSMLRVRLDSVDLTGLRIQGDRQSLSGNILTIRKVGPGNSKEISKEAKEYLKPTPFIPSDNEKVLKTAMEAVGNSKGWEAVKKILFFVDITLKNVPTFSIPNALDALKSKEGDCNEHAALAVALLRSIGIPSRVEVGVVYVGRAFYYHAWIGTFIGGRWVASDPTFGQFIADPTHIKLEYGGFEKQAKLYKVINKLQISVLEYD